MMSRTMVKTSVLRRWPMLSLGAILITSFALGYLFCFVRPVFLNPAQEMAFPRYIPAVKPIGSDLLLAYDFSKSWITGTTPEIPSLVYPPLERVLRLPLLVFPFRGAFVIQTLITLIAFMSVVLLLPKRFSKSPDWPALSGLFLAGLFSYGMQFEIERGQSNVVAMALVAWALVLFHYGKGLSARVLAYLFFSCAIQLKMFPAVFVIGFTRDARDWRRNLLRWGLLGVTNLVGLFALGLGAFQVFWETTITASGGSAVLCNHSIPGLSGMIKKMVDGYQPRYYSNEIVSAAASFKSLIPDALEQNFSKIVTITCLFILMGCFLIVLLLVYRRNDRSSFKYVMILCSLTALLAPSVSMDYKLTILVMAFAFFVSESRPIILAEKRGMLCAGLFLAVCLLLTLTLFPPELRPYLSSATPLLLTMAVLFTVLMALDKQSTSGEEDFPADLHE
jgi:hypothetical protein